MCRRTSNNILSLFVFLTVAVLLGCGGTAQSGITSAGQQDSATLSDASGITAMGTDFNGNKTPAYAYFGDRIYEQRVFDASSLQDEYVTNTKTGSYTVMVYLDGSTNLEDPNFEYEGATHASTTIDAILESGVDPDLVNVVIMTGGSDAWGHPGLEGNGNYILHVAKGDTGGDLSASVDFHSEDPLNMGDPNTLYSFVDFACKEYPADHYALMIWDHGDGPLYGCAVDENHDGDSLLLPEIAAALDATDFGKGKKFDWIGFDCCLMGDLEVADMLSKYSYYMIASQEVESGVSGNFDYGTAWVYNFLDVLNATSSPIAVTTAAIDRYADGKELASSDNNTHIMYTMSLMDLSKVEGVEQALDGLCHEMTNDLEAGDYANLAKLREYTKEFSEGGNHDIVDLGYMAWALEEEYPEEARDVTKAIEDLVLYQRTNVPEASGVSLYYPYRNEELYDKYGGRELYAEIAVSDGYLAYLDKFTDILINGEENVDWEIDQPRPEDGSSENSTGVSAEDEYTIRIPEEQQKGIARISYNILNHSAGNGKPSVDGEVYTMLLQDCQVSADADGVLHIPKNQKLLTLQGEGEEQFVWPFRQVSSGVQTAKYQSLATTVEGPFGAMAWTDPVPVTIIATESLGNGVPEISSISYRDEEDVIEGKSDVDLARYDYLAHLVLQSFAPSDPSLEPAWNWKQTDAIAGQQIPIDSHLRIGSIATSELEGDYVLQVVITDVHGKEYASELLQLDSLGVPSRETSVIDGLNCTFTVYDDHVALEKVEGSTGEFSVPSKYKEKPVTEILQQALTGASVQSIVVPDSVTKLGRGALHCASLETAVLPDRLEALPPYTFSECTHLTSVKLPQSLQSIGDSAFGQCKHLAMLEIPESVTYIGDGAFQGCDRLRHLTVADGNNTFMVEQDEDGNVLYTADGKELVACPGLFHSEYIVPEGTERIRDRAFYGCYMESLSGKADGSEGHNVVGFGLVRIVFPSTLREIGDAAFFECNRLESIELPENLEIIGIEAFGSTDFTGVNSFSSSKFEKDTIDEVFIGKDVRWVGQAAFNSFSVGRFIVDDRNQHYSSIDGRLMTKSGKKEVDVYGE